MYRSFVKRALDVALSAVGLALLAVPMAIIAVWVRLDSKGPALFKQRRVGKGKRRFTIYKFRTMSLSAPKDVATHLVGDPAEYVTRAGRILRKTSADELPQLLNILKGDMSFVGPRPALWNQFDLVAERDSYGANDIAPGLTGWAQVNGRDEISISEKAALDGEYARRRSFAFDLKCVALTFRSLIE